MLKARVSLFYFAALLPIGLLLDWAFSWQNPGSHAVNKAVFLQLILRGKLNLQVVCALCVGGGVLKASANGQN